MNWTVADESIRIDQPKSAGWKWPDESLGRKDGGLYDMLQLPGDG